MNIKWVQTLKKANIKIRQSKKDSEHFMKISIKSENLWLRALNMTFIQICTLAVLELDEKQKFN